MKNKSLLFSSKCN